MSVIELTNIATEYRLLQAEIKALEEQAESLKQAMIKEMDARQVDKLQAGAHEIRYTLVESTRLDGSRLKKDDIDLWEQYSKRTISTRFQVA
jgi:predicted phage-related endonuclease